MDRREAKKVIRQVETLPTLPVIITRILEVVKDERSSAKDLERIISCDQSITSRVLRIANSAYYGFSRKITTIHRAIVILGFQTVQGLALGSSIFETFFRTGRTAYFDRTAFWLHSIACSRCAMTLAQDSGELDPEEAFLAGLIHDIGMVVMDYTMHHEYSGILKIAMNQESSLDELERDAWGFDHGEVGAWLGERWGFPEPLLDAIRFHHRVSTHGRRSALLVTVIHLADFCSHTAGLGVTGHGDGAHIEEGALELTRIPKGNLTGLTHKIRAERDQIEAFFSAMSA